MSINQFKNKLCINLDRRADRWGSVFAEFQKYNVENVIRLSGCDGQTLNVNLRKEHKGELGSCISHLNAIKYAKEHNWDNVLIFEDDVKFHPDILPITELVLNDLPKNWDMLYFGGNHQGPITKINDYVGKTYRTFALQMYAVNAKIYDYLISMLENEVERSMKFNLDDKFVSLAGDYFIANHQPQFNTYVTLHKLSYQTEGFSDIQFDVVNYDHCLKN